MEAAEGPKRLGHGIALLNNCDNRNGHHCLIIIICA